LYPDAKSSFKEIQSSAELTEVQMPIPPSIGLAKQGQVLEYITKGKFNHQNIHGGVN